MLMKKSLILIMAFIFAVTAASADVEKDYRKLIKKYDAPEQVRIKADATAADFWNVYLYYDAPLAKFNKAILKNRGAEQEALKRLADLPKYYPRYDKTIVDGRREFCSSLLNDMGLDGLGIPFELVVIDSPDVNVLTLPMEDGFAICLTEGLLRKDGLTRDMLTGIVAHEFAHIALKHRVRGFYDEARNRRRATLVGGIVAGLLFAGEVALDYYTPYYDRYRPVDVDVDVDVNIKRPSPLYLYTMNQEYEADLAALRYMQFLGKGEAYLEALRFLASAQSVVYENPDGGNYSPRIEFMKYVADN